MAGVVLVTGAARGIGLELCRLLLEEGATVVACPRVGGAPGLVALGRAHEGRFHEIAMDVGDDRSVAGAARTVGERVDYVDLLFNNAGIYPEDDGVASLDTDALVAAFQVNAVGPLRVVRALLPLLRRGAGKRLVQVTSLMGSIGDNTGGGSYAYRMSKAALNMATKNLALELGGEGFVALAVHPGWVRTRMGGSAAPLEVAGAAREVLRIAQAAGPGDNGAFRGPGGRDLPF